MCIPLMDATHTIKMEASMITTHSADKEPNSGANTGNSERMIMMKLPVIAPTMRWNDTIGQRVRTANNDTHYKRPRTQMVSMQS